MFSKTNPWKVSALRLAGLALVASAVVAAPLSAESKRGGKRHTESPATWAGGAGSVLFAVAGSSGKKGGGAPLTAGGGQGPSAANNPAPAPAPTVNATNCTTIWHGKVIPCNGFSP